jgi:HSP20 family protein
VSVVPGGVPVNMKEVVNMALVRWNPVTELASMEIERLNDMFSEFYAGGRSRTWVPPVDIFENDNHEVVIKAELPEIKKEDISVTFENNVLTVKGERKVEQETKREQFQRSERFYGSFTRSFALPGTVDASRINASYKDGVLTITLPRREEAKPRQISVNVN